MIVQDGLQPASHQFQNHILFQKMFMVVSDMDLVQYSKSFFNRSRWKLTEAQKKYIENEDIYWVSGNLGRYAWTPPDPHLVVVMWSQGWGSVTFVIC